MARVNRESLKLIKKTGRLCNTQWLIGADTFAAKIRCINICGTAVAVRHVCYNDPVLPQYVHRCSP